MKKFFFTMVLAATACTATFANTTVQHDNGDDNVLATTLQQVKQRIAGAPSGTTYGGECQKRQCGGKHAPWQVHHQARKRWHLLVYGHDGPHRFSAKWRIHHQDITRHMGG